MTNSGILILSILDPLMDYSFEQKLKRSDTVEDRTSLEESRVASLETASSHGPTCHHTALLPAYSGRDCFSVSLTMWTKTKRAQQLHPTLSYFVFCHRC